NLGMVERQLDRLAEPRPGRIGRIVAAPDLVLASPDDRRVSQGDGPAAGVAARLGKESDWLNRTIEEEPRLLSQLAKRGGFHRLVDLEKATWNGPFSRERIAPAADQEDAERLIQQGEDDEVHRDLRARVVVAVEGWHQARACGARIVGQ